jgi:putative protease
MMNANTNLEMPEILAPAGEWASLHAALDAGCNAVYFGVEGLNMRAGSRNFRVADLPAIVRRCQHRGCRAYLTLNTLVFDHEFEMLAPVLQAAADAGVDAVIASDLAVIEQARDRGLEVHISTQMSVSNSRSLLLLYRQFGVRRVVPARECTLTDLTRMRRELAAADPLAAAAIEFEVFAHGAMCVSVSGRCFLSQFQTGKSANRGECQQPCRREYRIEATDEAAMAFDLGPDYVMSPQDLCTLPFLEQLIEAGVSSLKIEGRGRSPEYVGIVTRAYREVAEYYVSHRQEDGFAERFATLKMMHLERMQRVYNRGFSNGFYMGKPLDAWTRSDGSLATRRKQYAGLVVNYYHQAGAAEVQLHGCDVQVGDTVYFIGDTTGAVEQKVESMQVEHEPVSVARKGMHVAIRTNVKVRRQDKLYVVVATGDLG